MIALLFEQWEAPLLDDGHGTVRDAEDDVHPRLSLILFILVHGFGFWFLIILLLEWGQ